MGRESVFDLFPVEQQKPGGFEAVVATAAAAVSDKIYVVIPSFDDKLRFGPCAWPARAGVLPQRGDSALVVFDDKHVPWVVAWWPYG